MQQNTAAQAKPLPRPCYIWVKKPFGANQSKKAGKAKSARGEKKPVQI